MTYHPDYPTHSAEAHEWRRKAKLAENQPETGPEYATFADNSLIDHEDQETHPPAPSLDPDLASQHGVILPPGTRLITDADWEILVDMKVNKRTLGLCLEYGRDKVAGWIAAIEGELEEPGTIEATAEKRAAARRAASKRRVGALSTPALIRKEMAALYRETYLAEPDDARHHTRMMYMLDCLARTAAVEQKLKAQAEKAGQSAGE